MALTPEQRMRLQQMGLLSPDVAQQLGQVGGAPQGQMQPPPQQMPQVQMQAPPPPPPRVSPQQAPQQAPPPPQQQEMPRPDAPKEDDPFIAQLMAKTFGGQ